MRAFGPKLPGGWLVEGRARQRVGRPGRRGRALARVGEGRQGRGYAAAMRPAVDLLAAASYAHGQPHEQFRWLREHDPVHRHPEPDGPGFWALTRWWRAEPGPCGE